MPEGGSAGKRADELRAQAAAARARAAALEREAGAWQAGADGERQVAIELGNLPSTWRVLHDRLLRPGRSRTNIDHLVVGPSGVYLIDAKNWAGGVSVYDGTLWQHNGGTRCRRDALEQVHRFAAEVERAVALPVTPILVLAGTASSRFTPQRVGGVEVLPLRRLHKWLNAQRHGDFVRDVDGLAKMLDLAYPLASTTETFTIPAPVPTSRSTSLGPTAYKSRPRARAGRASTGRRNPLFQLAIVLFGAWFMTQVVVPRMMQAAQHSTNVRSAPAAPAYPVCDSVLATTIQKHVKHATSVESASNRAQTCAWRLSSTGESRTFSLTVTFGQAARLEVDVIGQGKPKVFANNGYAVARIPAGTQLPGWSKSANKTNQPIALTLSYPVPTSGKAAEVQKANTAAVKGITALSEEVARAVAAVDDVKTVSQRRISSDRGARTSLSRASGKLPSWPLIGD